MVAASFFIVCGVSASDTVYQTPLDAGETVSPTLTGGYYNVTLEPGQRFFFSWSIGQNGGASNITLDGVSPVSAGSSYAFIWSQVTTQVADQSGTRGYAEFANVGSASFTINCSVSINFTLRNNNSTTATPRVLLTVSGGQYLSSSYVTNNQLNSKLNQILDALGSGGFADYLGEDALFYFDNRYFRNGWVGSNVAANDNGFFVVQSTGNNMGFSLDGGLDSDKVKLIQLIKGSYVFSFSGFFESAPTTVTCNGVTISDLFVKQDSANSSHYFISGVFTFDNDYLGRDISFGFGANLSPGIVWGGISRAPDDYLAGSAMNPDQSGLVSDVDNAGQQQQQQEDQLWTNINSYKGDLTFNLDDWSEAAGGLSYVSSIFMTIWNNSPTQVIVLSLMLGIAMLSIGRGAMAAVRVSRNRRDDD